jgi:hypothetical protein
MALTGTDRGTGGNTTTSTTLTISPASNFTPGTLAVLCVGYDNSASGGADPFTSIADNAGNQWTSRIASLNDPGAALAGACLRIFTAYIGKLLTTDTVTITLNTTTPSKAWTLMQVAAAAAFTAEYVTSGQATGSTLNPSLATSSIPVGDMTIGAVAAATTSGASADTDTLNGSWSTAQAGTAGNATSASNIQTISQRKVQTTTPSAQTYNLTLAAATWCEAWVEVTERAIPAGDLWVTRSRVRA